ncbi:MAG: glycosyltransferase family 4 protein [bacterium]
MAKDRIVIFGWAHSVHVQRWARGLSDRGYQIRIVSLGGEPLPDIDTVVLLRRGKLSYIRQAPAAVRAARDFEPDLVHVHYAGGFGLWGRYCGIRPLVVSVWGSDLLPHRPKWFYRRLLGSTLKQATHITATSQWLSKQTGELYPAATDKMSVIPFGAQLPDQTKPLPDGPLRICYLKGHRPVYGPDILLEAMVEVRKAIPDVVLSMAGEGEMTTQLNNMIVRLGLEDTVQMVGYIERPQVADFLQVHHFMVMPSRAESFGLAALEAAACSRAVIASNVGGVPELVVEGVTGLLVPPGNPQRLAAAIIELANNADKQKEMGRAGRDLVKRRYLWGKSLNMMCRLYERLLGGPAEG